LRKVLDEVCRDLGARIEEAGAEVECELDAEVLGEPRQLRQVFWNLIDNALKFRDPQHAPRIAVRLDPEPPADAPDQVHILVEDNGIGIPPDQAHSVFEAFRRVHPREQYPGMGLALAFCRKIVEGLGGRISVDSEPGRGSVFRVILPRAPG
jgi:signal transduction histidine kinase